MSNDFDTHVNRPSTKVDAPTIVLTGKLVDTSTGEFESNPDGQLRVSNQDIRIDRNIVYNREVKVFQGRVKVQVVPDPTWTPARYSEANSKSNGTTKVTGVTRTDKNHVNKKSETWYTTNGKDPVRTKSKLYTGKSFTILRNESGDNTVLKFRTYQGGRASAIRSIEFRILRESHDIVHHAI
jgi:hypothetical protein